MPLAISGLLFIPPQNVEMMGSVPLNLELSLYSRRVLIKANCEELLPKWLRFVKGVIDCSDISLNVSRETAQDSGMIERLKDLLTKRILRSLKEELERDPQRFNTWYKDFNHFLKEGVALTSQHGQINLKEQIVPLLRIETSYSNDLTGLEDYVANMKQGQKSIYIVSAKTRVEAEKSP